MPIRAFADTGSQVNLITEGCAQRLGLKRTKSTIPLIGIDSIFLASGTVHLELANRQSDINIITITAIVVPKIAARLPDKRFQNPFVEDFGLNELADSRFNIPGEVEMLLGVGFWASIIDGQIKRKSTNGVISLAQSTSFGWVIFGQMALCSHLRVASCQISIEQKNVELDQLLLKFWSADDMNPKRAWTQEEQRAENIFVATHRRDENGRYVVQIPRKADAPSLGNSRAAAKACFLSVERKLAKNPELQNKYRAVFNDYQSKQHLVLAVEPPISNEESYYMQHHAINTNSNQPRGKFRVVFNASAPSSNGTSFNDQQLTGPKLIDDIGEFFIRFRTRRYAITADISQMYRQVRIDPLEWNYQRVIYRDHPDLPLLEYVYTVVTWGMASASFNAIRALRQLAIDEMQRFPIGAQVVLNDFYIDDMLTGSDTKLQLREVHHQVTKLLRTGGFELAKWATNDTELAAELNQGQRNEITLPIESGVLGMKWMPNTDMLALNVVYDSSEVPDNNLTKRKVISMTSQIYDPTGLIAPCIVTGKILQQNIWRSGIDWDEKIPNHLITEWHEYKQSIKSMDKIRIPRWIPVATGSSLQLHVFTDASELAMGAAIYLRTMDVDNNITVTLVTSKSKVAPVKKVTIPRLELTAAHIGAQLYQYTKSACRFGKIDVYFWTDSTIVAYWIKRDPAASKPFVANRVIDIRQLCDGAGWRHIDGLQNPADLLTRGISAKQLIESDLWWHGPAWLVRPQEEWPRPIVTSVSANMFDAIQAESNSIHHASSGETIIQTKSKKGIMVAMVISGNVKLIGIKNAEGKFESLIDRISELSKLLRVTSYVFRFIDNLRLAIKLRKESLLIDQNRIGQNVPAVSASERRKALEYWISVTQFTYFPKEIKCCQTKVTMPSNSSIIKLAPFIDEKNILRVGGRLVNANCPKDSKHQIILPPKARLTHLIVREAHFVTIHGQTQLMMAHLRRSFWFTRMRQVLKSAIHTCPTCIRHNQPQYDQLMGNLPAIRVNVAEPFAHTGVDFAGPFIIRKSPGRPPSARGKSPETTLKAWIAVFVCMATRASHLEVCVGLVVEEFMAAYERFVMRKGRCFHLSSDNGTTFVGTDNELKRVLAHWAKTMPEQFLAKYNTKWHFITPAAPFKGGIWEAAVKSMKRHLKRAIGKQVLTKDDLNQLAIQIEGCLNSRPLWPLSDDPSDLMPMTPAHFVLGKPILPQPLAEDVAETPQNRLTVWAQKQQLHQNIWKRWREEYLTTLQQRTKWYKIKTNLKAGEMVVIRDENSPPASWLLGRVEKVFTAADGLVRSAIIRTTNGELERPINKLCILPPPESPVDHPINGGEDVQK